MPPTSAAKTSSFGCLSAQPAIRPAKRRHARQTSVSGSGSAVALSARAIGDPRVEVSVGDVDGQAREQKHEHADEDNALDRRIVAGAQALDRQPSDAGPGKDRLGDEGSFEKEPHLEP